MQYLVDTSALARSLDARHPDREIATAAVERLVNRGDQLEVSPQVLYEWWAVATRPREFNGLGMTVQAASSVLATLANEFTIRFDRKSLFLAWRKLVVQYGVTGKKAHDARLVAAMESYSLTHLLTFNVQDFTRFPFIVVVSPHDVVNEPAK